MAISDYIYFNFSDKTLQKYKNKSLRDMENLIKKFEFYFKLTVHPVHRGAFC